MRARNIKPGFFENEFLAELPFETRLLFAGLWCYADRDGRFECRPKKIKIKIFPYDNVDITVNLRLLNDHGFITLYSVDDVEYGQVNNFNEHQSPHHTEKASKILDISLGTVNSPLIDGGNPPDSLIPDSLIPDSLIEDQKKALKAFLSYLKKLNRPPVPAIKNQIAVDLSSLLRDKIMEFNTNHTSITEKHLAGWSKTIDLMIRKDNRTTEQIEYMIRWLYSDQNIDSEAEFVVESASSLREKFDKIARRIKRDSVAREKNQTVSSNDPRVMEILKKEEAERIQKDENRKARQKARDDALDKELGR